MSLDALLDAQKKKAARPAGRPARKRRGSSSDDDYKTRQRRLAAAARKRRKSSDDDDDDDEYESEASSSGPGLHPDKMAPPSGFSGAKSPTGTSWMDRHLNAQAEEHRKRMETKRRAQEEAARKATAKAKVDKAKREVEARENAFLKVAQQQEEGDDSDGEGMTSFFAQMNPGEAKRIREQRAAAAAAAQKAAPKRPKKFRCRYPIGSKVKFVGGGRYAEGQMVRWNEGGQLRSGDVGAVEKVDEKDEDPYHCRFPCDGVPHVVQCREGDLQRVIDDPPPDAGGDDGDEAGC